MHTVHTVRLVPYVFISNFILELEAEASLHVEADGLVVGIHNNIVIVGRFRGGFRGGWSRSGARHHGCC